MKRSWLAPLFVTLAAVAGGSVPLLACSGAEGVSGTGGFSTSGAPGSSSTGYGEGSGGGPYSDAQVDVVLNDDDPPPFTGKSYCYLCGGGTECQGLACDPTSGECVDGGATMDGMGCKLVPNDTDAGDGGEPGDGGPAIANAVCAAAGTADQNKPCYTSSDCGPGLGCVGKPMLGQCLPYCCQDTESCMKGTWCVPERLSEDPNQKVPVCIPASNCSLLDHNAPCPDGLMCTIVRTDGTTACVLPGSGTAGDGCPCAPGYVCSQLGDKCFKLCHLGNDAECPDGSLCVGGVGGYPDGIGNCVGSANN